MLSSLRMKEVPLMKNVVGLFDSIRDAEAVVRDLRDAGVAEADISFAGRNPDDATMQSNEYIAEGHSEAAEGAGFGATGGAVVGGLTGLLVGLGVLAIPGVGPVLAGGTLAAALGSAAVGAGIGAAAGGLLGALVGAGIPEEDAHVYAEGIRRGGALVMARVDDSMVDTALDIMERHNAVDIDERGRTYRETGWTGYDPNAEPYADTTARAGDRDNVPDRGDWEDSSKAGTAGGTLAGAATGAAVGSAGGPVGTVVGGVAGAVTGGAVGAAGDAAGAEATDDDTLRDDYDTTRTVDYDTTRVDDYDTTTAAGYDRGMGDADNLPDRGDYERSSGVGTAGGAVAGGATGAAMGAAGGPVGAVIGGAAGAVAGAGVGAAGDAVGAEATDDDTARADYDTTRAGDTGFGTAGAGDYTTRPVSDVDDTYTTTNFESQDTTGYSAESQEYRGDVDTEGVPDEGDWERSSKAGTAGGTLAGAATGAALGAAGGPVGVVVGGVAGAVTGGAVGAAGDAAGAEATDDDTLRDEVSPVDRQPAAYDSTTATFDATGTDYDSTRDAGYTATGDADSVPDQGDWERSSKAGTAGGGLAGAATGAAMGSAAGPVGTVIGGVAGAAAGAGVGAAGDAVGAEATDDDAGRTGYAADRDVTDTAGYDPDSPYRPATTDRTDDSLTDRAERTFDADLDRDGDVGGTPRTDI
jgi:hypothetical protein